MQWLAQLKPDQRFVILAWPTIIAITLLAVRGAPRLYRRLLGLRPRRRAAVSAGQGSVEIGNALVRCDLPAPGGEAAAVVATAMARVRARSRRRLLVEVSVLAVAITLAGLGWFLEFARLDALQLGVFAGWVVGTWALRSVFFARRPRISEPVWGAPSVLVGFGLAGGIGGMLFIPDDATTRLTAGALAMVLLLGCAGITLYLVLGAQALLRSRRFSADTAAHVLHWCIAALAYSLLWGGLGPRGGWLLGAVWILGIPALLWASHEPTAAARPLVFLRNFTLGDRSARLLRAVAETWLELGPVDLVTGPDVAGAKPDPAMILAMITLRLRKRFVSGPADAKRAVASLNTSAPWDGRHRIRELACRDSAWEAAVSSLVTRPGVTITMDLREFDADNLGCARELKLLGQGAVLAEGRHIMLIDDRTDLALLANVVQRYTENANGGLRVYNVGPDDRESAARIVALAWSASGGGLLG